MSHGQYLKQGFTLNQQCREVAPFFCYMFNLMSSLLQNQPMLTSFGDLQLQNCYTHRTVWRLWPWWMVSYAPESSSQWPSTGGHCYSSETCTPPCCSWFGTGECGYGIIWWSGCRSLIVLLSYRWGIGLPHDTSPEKHYTQQYYGQG